ncbi:PKD domain-containing protein [Candidatus Micrarchaeota archaeon]|nr:PKD domain-containing protein [Candidatus Micrarchaeota archaeon]
MTDASYKNVRLDASGKSVLYRGRVFKLMKKAVTSVEFILLIGISVFIVVLVVNFSIYNIFNPALNQSNSTSGILEERTACFDVDCGDTCEGNLRKHSAVCEDGTCIYRASETCTYGCSNGVCLPVDPEVTFDTAMPAAPRVDFYAFVNDSTGADYRGNVSKYYWDFGDHNITVTDVYYMEHTYGGPGEFNVTLSIIDHFGNQAATIGPVVVT